MQRLSMHAIVKPGRIRFSLRSGAYIGAPVPIALNPSNTIHQICLVPWNSGVPSTMSEGKVSYNPLARKWPCPPLFPPSLSKVQSLFLLHLLPQSNFHTFFHAFSVFPFSSFTAVDKRHADPAYGGLSTGEKSALSRGLMPQSVKDDPNKSEGAERYLKEHHPEHRARATHRKEGQGAEGMESKTEGMEAQEMESEGMETKGGMETRGARKPIPTVGGQPADKRHGDPAYGGLTTGEKAALSKGQHVHGLDEDPEKAKGAEKYLKEHGK
jgi:hypothetical protein